MLDGNKVMITVALNGGMQQDRDGAAVPKQPDEIGEAADQTLFVPRTDWILQPIVAIVPLQLLAYYIAREKGLNVDQPRNMAKTVTVE